jgi:hypothetical protein
MPSNGKCLGFVTIAADNEYLHTTSRNLIMVIILAPGAKVALVHDAEDGEIGCVTLRESSENADSLAVEYTVSTHTGEELLCSESDLDAKPGAERLQISKLP